MKRRHPNRPPAGKGPEEEAVVGLRIIGGTLRGRSLQYTGDLRTRPMKDRVREAVFNLLGPGVKGTHAIDLFAGTGALGLEAVSRGASRATLIERHHPTTLLIQQNVVALGIANQVEVVFGDAFQWTRRFVAAAQAGGSPSANPQSASSQPPWTIFCSPPYDFYVDRNEEMLAALGGLVAAAPEGSLFAVEADERFDFRTLPEPDSWDLRQYPPAVVGIWQKLAP